MKQFNFISGWDIGGAHIKVARYDTKGQLMKIIQVACPLWRGIDQLELAIQSIIKQLDNQHDLTAVTMTGELVDIFPNRQAGVKEILACLSQAIAIDNIRVYAAKTTWLSPKQAEQQWQQVASRNWQASATLAATQIPAGLFIDIGSTSCDIIPFTQGKVHVQGFDDFQRQTSRELLYTGAIRTPLIALCQDAPFNGISVSLAAELFATTGDCWILLNKITAESIQDDSADGQPWNHSDCRSRLARLLGTDAHHANEEQWRQLAQWFAEQQVHHITQAILQVLSSQLGLNSKSPIIGAGVGRFIVKMCAQRLDIPYIDFNDLISSNNPQTADHAPAVAVALLAQQKLT